MKLNGLARGVGGGGDVAVGGMQHGERVPRGGKLGRQLRGAFGQRYAFEDFRAARIGPAGQRGGHGGEDFRIIREKTIEMAERFQGGGDAVPVSYTHLDVYKRQIENLLEKVPNCPRALSDQFGPEQQIQRALQKKGRKIKLEQRHKAESDIAVAAASILARSAFLSALDKLSAKYGVKLPKGASEKVKAAAAELVQKHGGAVFLETAKCHFKTTDDVLESLGKTRAGGAGFAVLPPIHICLLYTSARRPITGCMTRWGASTAFWRGATRAR